MTQTDVTRGGPTGSASGEPRSRSFVAVVVVIGVVALLVIGLTTWLTRDDEPEPLARSTSVEVYYLGGPAERSWLYPERHTLNGAGSQLELAVNQALGTPLDPDYRIGFPAGTSASVTVDGSTATIDLHGSAIEAAPAAPTGVDGALAIQALVHTVRANSDRDLAVSFRVGGQPAKVLLGEELSGTVAPASEDRVLSPVRLHIEEGAVLREGAEVTGTAAVFEATVVWQISGRDSGSAIEDGHTMAEECCRPMPFSITLPSLPAGTYVLEVAETDPSDGEGLPPASDSKTFTVG